MSVLQTLLYNFIIISIVSFCLTYYFAIYLNLSWYQLLFVFSIILWINQKRLLYIAPLQEVMNILKQTNSYTIFGAGIFALANIYLNIGVSAWRFGWLSALGLSVSSAALCGVAMGVEQKLIRT